VRTTLIRALAITAIAVGLAACGSDDAASTTTAKKNEATTTNGGGGAQAGKAQFLTFTASSSAVCRGGNAEVTMSWTTENAVSIDIKIDQGEFASTAGYGPNEPSAVANIPCTGAGTGTIQLRACTEDHECTDSEVKSVEITES